MRRALIIVLCCWFVSIPAQAQSGLIVLINQIEATPRTDGLGHDVTAAISVSRADGTAVTDLSATAFTVREDGQDIAAPTLSSATFPINVILALDTSESMAYGGRMSSARDGSVAFLQTLVEGDGAALLSFNAQAIREHNFTNTPADIIAVLRRLEAVRGGITCLWDAAYMAAELGTSLPAGNRAVVLMTDGSDYSGANRPCSTKTLDDVITLASTPTTRVPFYAVGVGQEVNRQDLTRLSELTGGRASFVLTAQDVMAELDGIAQRLRAGYQLHYVSAGASGEHQLFVEVAAENLSDQEVQRFVSPPPAAQLMVEGVEDEQTIASDLEAVVAVSGDVQPSRVQFFVNDQLAGDDTLPPFSMAWSTAGLASGTYRLRFVASDSAGIILAQRTLTVTYAAPPPTSAPTAAPTATAKPLQIAFVGLGTGSLVRGDTSLVATVQGGTPEHLDFYVDESLLTSDAMPPYEASWEASAYTPGQHTIGVIAYADNGAILGRHEIAITYERSASAALLGLGAGAGLLLLVLGGFVVYALRRKPATVLPEPRKRAAFPSPAPSASELALAVLTVEHADDPSLIGQRCELGKTPATVGRGEECDFVVPEKAVSRRHATVAYAKGGTVPLYLGAAADRADYPPRFYITDHDSTFGTYVNDQQVAAGDTVELRNGVVIRLGPRLKLRFRETSSGTPGDLRGQLTVDEIDVSRTMDQGLEAEPRDHTRLE